MRTSREFLISLQSENQKSIDILKGIHSRILILEKRIKEEREDEYLWLAMSQLISSYYTLCETILFRVAQSFENSLDSSKWHKDLLDKMRIEISGIRPAFLSDELFHHLDSIRRFRHFLRYYHELTLDVEEIKLLLQRIKFVQKEFLACNKRFSDFIKELSKK